MPLPTRAIPGPRNDRMAENVVDAGRSLLLSFSRTQESEADRVGMIVAARAGYDPRAAIGFWQRMKTHERQTNPRIHVDAPIA